MRLFLLALSAAPLFAQHLVTVRGAHRTFTIDTDDPEIIAALRPAADTTAPRIPSWLYPFAGAEPSDCTYDAKTGAATATFLTSASETQAAAFYRDALRAHRMKLGTQEDAITGSSITAAISIQMEALSDCIRLRIRYAPARTTYHSLEDVGYDEASGVLRLRDTSTGREFELDTRKN